MNVYFLIATSCLIGAAALKASGYTADEVSTRASWYGDECKGRLMANGKPFDPGAMTCASWDYPLGTKLRVYCGWRGVNVTVTDRGPAKRLLSTRRLDLSRAAFKAIAPLEQGVIPVRIVRQ